MHATHRALVMAKSINCSDGFWLIMAATCRLQMHHPLKKNLDFKPALLLVML